MAEITWLGQECFRLRGKDATIVTDPFERTGQDLSKARTDIVTLSHEDANEKAAGALRGEFRVLHGPGEYEVKGVFITGVGTFADNKKGQEKGKNTIYMYELDDLNICHLGHLGHVLTTTQAEALSDVHVLLVPVGGSATFDSAKAAEVIAQLEPNIVIPMLNKSGDDKLDADLLEKFMKDMGVSSWQAQDKLAIKASDLPETTSVILLEQKS